MTMTNSVLITLVIYIPFHLFEEAVGKFPRWMYEHHWLPRLMTHGHWMANNLFIYYPLLLVAVFLYAFGPAFACCGVGALVWGLINFGDHFFYTLRDRKVSPGLITGIAFLINSSFGLRSFAMSPLFSIPALFAGIAAGAALFAAPLILCVALYRFIDKLVN